MTIIKETIPNISELDFEKLYNDFYTHIKVECNAQGFKFNFFHDWLIKTKFYKQKFTSRGSSHGQRESDNARIKFSEEILNILEDIGMVSHEVVKRHYFRCSRIKDRHYFFTA